MNNKPEFDSYAQNYEELLADPLRDGFVKNAEFFHQRKWELLEEFAQRRNLRMADADWLDVGCGKGELLRLGQKAFRSVTGCDPSAGMLSDCEGVRVEKQEDLGKLPFADASFDWVTAVCVYHHIPPANRAAFTQEVRRVLRPGGYCIFIEHNPYNPATQLIVSRTPVDADAVLLGGGESLRLQREAGMENLELRYFLYLPEALYRSAGAVERLLHWLPLGGQYMAVSRKGA